MMGGRTLAGLALTLLLAVCAQAHKRSWTLNFPKSPVSLVGESNGYFTVTNRSSHRITLFTLACVASNRKRAVTLYGFAPRREALDPGWSVSSGVFDAPYTDEYAECVVRRKATLAVVHVEFSDGTSWSAPVTSDSAAAGGPRK